MPQRIQLSRRKGWRKPEGAIVVSRPSRWGNPFKPWMAVGRPGGEPGEVGWFAGAARLGSRPIRWGEGARAAALADCVEAFREHAELQDPADFEPLAGHDLACWCPLDRPCHADVLLEVANRGR